MFCKKLDLKISAEIDQIEKFVFQVENIFKALRYVFPSYSFCQHSHQKLSIFLLARLVSHGIKMLKIFFLQIKYSNKCHLSRQLGGGGVPLQQSRGFKTPLPSQKTNQIQLTDKKKPLY